MMISKHTSWIRMLFLCLATSFAASALSGCVVYDHGPRHARREHRHWR
ncbi:MAG TPA: hypothetical protein VGH28_04285 [Polyangiaceae bacterium]|jgi:hypothetical protein